MTGIDEARRRLRRLRSRAARRWRALKTSRGRHARHETTGVDDLLAPEVLLRVEGGAVALAATLGYFVGIDAPPAAFLLLVVAPDLSLAGYLVDERWGVRTYNAVHTYLWPAAFAVVGWLLASDVAVWIALAWAAHLGVDRAFGLGLKYASGSFRDTHLQRA